MPAKLKPGAKLPVVLDCDKDDSASDRAVFFGKVLTVSESIEIDDRLSNKDFDTAEDVLNDRIQLLVDNLIGWKNLPVEYTKDTAADELKKMLTQAEVIELIRAIQFGNTTTLEEKKS